MLRSVPGVLDQGTGHRMISRWRASRGRCVRGNEELNTIPVRRDCVLQVYRQRRRNLRLRSEPKKWRKYSTELTVDIDRRNKFHRRDEGEGGII